MIHFRLVCPVQPAACCSRISKRCRRSSFSLASQRTRHRGPCEERNRFSVARRRFSLERRWFSAAFLVLAVGRTARRCSSCGAQGSTPLPPSRAQRHAQPAGAPAASCSAAATVGRQDEKSSPSQPSVAKPNFAFAS